MEERYHQRDAALCWQFPYSPASPCFPIFMRLSSPLKTLVFRICVSLYLIRKKSIASLDPLEHKTLEVDLSSQALGGGTWSSQTLLHRHLANPKQGGTSQRRYKHDFLVAQPCLHHSGCQLNMYFLRLRIWAFQSWTYAMTFVVSMVFRVLPFPHEGRIVTVDHLLVSHADPIVSPVYVVRLIENS
jgi:hypothetical protein